MSTTIVLLILLIIVLVACYLYFSYTQTKIDGLEQENAKLAETVQVQQQTIIAQQNFAIQQNSALTTLQTNLQAANGVKTQLLQTFATGNLDDAARSNALILQDQVNAETQNAINALQDLTNATPPSAPTTTVLPSFLLPLTPMPLTPTGPIS
jgi:Tfp pilus assembly protein PilO